MKLCGVEGLSLVWCLPVECFRAGFVRESHPQHRIAVPVVNPRERCECVSDGPSEEGQ
jgi:hypothetical protein